MKKRRPTRCLRATLLLLPFLFPDIILAQPSSPGVAIFPNPNDDFKHYSTVPATPGGAGIGVIMVGTRFTNAAGGNRNYTHFARVDNGTFPNVYAWKYLQENSANCVDERSVHAVANTSTPDEYFLTSLVRFDNGGFFEDGIKIYAVNHDGNLRALNPTSVIKSDNENLYPMHSLYHNGYLYICGYAMAQNSLSLPDQGPTYIPNSYGSTPRWEKEAFVMRVDPTNLTVTHFQKMDYTFQYAGAGGGIYPHPSGATVNQPTGGSDFDMAVRMTVLPSDNIHVTGSVNAMSFSLGAPSGAVNDWDNSAVMNIVMDPVNLNILHDKPFRMENGGGWNEAMGIGIVPATTLFPSVSQGFFLVGNHYTPEIWLPNYGDLGGYCPIPHYPFATYLLDVGGFPEPIYNTNLEAYVPYGGGPVNASQTMMSLGDPISQGGYWAVNLVDCPGGLYCNLNALNNDPQQVVWIAGYRGGNMSNNYEVTLSKINLAYDLGNNRPGLGLSEGTYYETQVSNYHSALGPDPTGPIFVTPTLVPNNFFALGLGLSNMMWSPTFATRMANDDILVAAPKWNPAPGGGANGKLNVKLIKASIQFGNSTPNGGFGGPTCGASHDLFTYDTVGRRVIEPHGIDMNLDINYNNSSVIYPTSSTVVITRQTHPSSDCATNGGDYKLAGVDEIISSTRTLVYPNPAGSQVFVVPASGIAGGKAVDVVLLNLLGQAVGKLYSGEAAGLGAKNALQLPELANGLYMIQLQSNGQLLHNERLTIQK